MSLDNNLRDNDLLKLSSILEPSMNRTVSEELLNEIKKSGPDVYNKWTEDKINTFYVTSKECLRDGKRFSIAGACLFIIPEISLPLGILGILQLIDHYRSKKILKNYVSNAY